MVIKRTIIFFMTFNRIWWAVCLFFMKRTIIFFMTFNRIWWVVCLFFIKRTIIFFMTFNRIWWVVCLFFMKRTIIFFMTFNRIWWVVCLFFMQTKYCDGGKTLQAGKNLLKVRPWLKLESNPAGKNPFKVSKIIILLILNRFLATGNPAGKYLLKISNYYFTYLGYIVLFGDLMINQFQSWAVSDLVGLGQRDLVVLSLF